MPRLHSAFLILFTVLLSAPITSRAEEAKPDDRVIFDVSAEDWVATKTARVTMHVEAAVTGNSEGSTRAAMTKALEDLVKTDWRLTSFNRGQDQTGMERWSAMFEARIPENQLAGIHDNAKKVSKPGMQVTVGGIDFSPTLDEIQAAQGQLRTKIYKMVNDQLTALNTALPGRAYRIALIEFEQNNAGPPNIPVAMLARRAKTMTSEAMLDGPPGAGPMAEPSMERSQKMTLTANVVFAITPPAAPSSK